MGQLINSYRFATGGGGGLAGPTRFYLEASGTVAVAPAYDAAWGNTVLGDSIRFHPARLGTTIASKNGVGSATTSTNINVLHRQFVSRPLAAQTIDGTVKGIVKGAESNLNGDMRTQIVITVWSNDASTLRGTLLAADSAALSNEFGTTASTRKIPVNYAGAGASLTPVVAQAGDLLVVEVGVRKTNTTNQWVSYFFGSSDPADFAETESLTTTLNQWVEFSDGIEFQSGSAPTLIDAAVTPGVTTNSIVVPVPATVTAGDFLILVPVHTGTVASVTGYTLDTTAAGTQITGYIFTRVADGSEASGTVTVNFSSSDNGGVALYVVRGGAGVIQRGTYRANSNLASFAVDVPGTVPDDLILYFGAVRTTNATTLTQTTGTTDDTEVAGGMKGMIAGHATSTEADYIESQTWNSSVVGGTAGAVGQFGAVIVMGRST